jgi:3-oxoadipate enol-lactonase
MKKQSVGNIQLAYIEEGQGETIVLLHGFCGSKDYWKELIPLLSKNFKVLAIDLRGHGDSEAGEASFEIEDLAKDVNDFLEQKSINSIHLIGHSMGGYVALAFAELFPSKLASYSLFHSTAYPDSDEAKHGRNKAIETIEKEGMVSFIDGLIPKLFSDEFLERHPNVVENIKKIGYETSPAGAIYALKAMRNRPDRHSVLKNSHTPVLLIAGRNDKVISVERTLSVTASHVTTTILEHSGHMGMLEEPNQAAEIIHRFIHDLS